MILALRRLTGKALSAMALCVLLVQLPCQGQGRSPAAARLGGTFIQLSDAHGDWTVDDWKPLFDDFQSLQLSQLIVQWTVYDATAFYPSESYRERVNPQLETILKLADEAGMRVRVGLAHDSQYWDKVGRRRIASVGAYLRRLRYRSLSIARELVPLVADHPSFQGWYIPEEVDDTGWLEPERRQVLFAHLAELTSALRPLVPQAEIALSGFSNANTDPVAFERFYTGLLQAATADVVLLQDGIGVKKLDLEYLELYLAAMRRAVEAEGRDLQVIVELFRQVEGPPLDEKPFKAVPASVDRIRRQLELASKYSSAGVMAFSVPDYMSPSAGPDARQLLQEYLKAFATPQN